ncbi:serine hydrolase, partial [Streptomyces anulatus]|nr:serine hydrolase [Streptomyces anulatus]
MTGDTNGRAADGREGAHGGPEQTGGHGSSTDARTAGSGIARRRVGGGILALGGALALTPIPLAGAAAR